MAAVLADFRTWLTELGSSTAEEMPAEAAAERIDLHTLLGQFLAVRQEVNLQTRAVRAQQEHNSETLRQLTAALDALQQRQQQAELAQRQARDEAIRPLLKTLVDLYDALAIAGREIERMGETVRPALEQLAAPLTPTPLARSTGGEGLMISPLPPEGGEGQGVRGTAPRSFWARLIASFLPVTAAANEQRTVEQERERLARESSERVRPMLASLVTGYTMSLQRVERALRQHGLEAIPTVGQRFDPERMEVVEAVPASGRPAGEVIEEVRRGYLCEGRVFRYAQVRVAKS